MLKTLVMAVFGAISLIYLVDGNDPFFKGMALVTIVTILIWPSK